MTSHRHSEGWVAAVRRFTKPTPATARCDLCGVGVLQRHSHLWHRQHRDLVCVCRACALLTASRDDIWANVPERSTRIDNFQLHDAQWSAIGIPVGIAFFVKRSEPEGIAAFYPGAAGTTESLLDLSAWCELEDANPMLRELEPDVEALVVNHLDGARDYYRMPIDCCYALAGSMRANWQGFTGGEGVRKVIAEFFAEIAA